MQYELNIEQFRGPIGKLLELIESKKLDIGEISLAQVTNDFLNYVEVLKKSAEFESGKRNMQILADFIVVASKLIFIKSKYIMPDLSFDEDDEKDARDLEFRLKIYKRIKPMEKNIVNLWSSRNSEVGRAYLMGLKNWGLASGSGFGVFYPKHGIKASTLNGCLKNIFGLFEKIAKESKKVIREKIISLEEKIREIVKKIDSMKETSFTSLLGGSNSKQDIIASFLAILHLSHDQIIFLEQENHFSDIIIRKSESAGDD